MKKTTRRLWAVAMVGVFALSMFCTISEDNGNPIDPGDSGSAIDTVRGGADTARGSGSALNPDIDAPSVLTAGIDDTISVEVWLFADASSSEPLTGRTINISTEREEDWVSANSRRTDAAGKIEVKFSSPIEGKAPITFTYNVSNGRSVTSTTTILVTNNPIRKIFINASPSWLTADGTSKSTITVQVKNDNNNPIVGDVIMFSSTAGFIVAQATTDADGKATAQLTSDRRNDTAEVKAWLKSNITLNAQIKVEFSGVTVSASVSPEAIKPNDEDSAVVTALLLDAANNPIVGEKITFLKDSVRTKFIKVDSTTNNRGVARCVLKSAATSSGEWITARAAGAETKVFVTYTTQILTITSAGNDYYAGNDNKSTFAIRYTQGNGTTPLPNAIVRVTVTTGTLAENADPDNPNPARVIFAKEIELKGRADTSFTMNNPDFAGYATVYVKGSANSSSAVDLKQIYFQSGNIKRIEIIGSPAVIGTNGGIAKISAIAYDESYNRVGHQVISFNIVKGTGGGGEYLDPPTATTAIDGMASTNLKAGILPSVHKGVWVVASDYYGTRSDTVKFTIAGPPQHISVTAAAPKNIVENGKSLYDRALSAIVTDINHNPIPDGTEVTFITSVRQRDIPDSLLNLISQLPPIPVVVLTRTVLTKDGIANNILTYGQLEANNAVVKGEAIYETLISVECQGILSAIQHVYIEPPPEEESSE